MSAPAEIRALRMAGGTPIVETRHRAHVAVVAPDGRVLASAGDVSLVTPLRSCAKPFQALPLFTSGANERFTVTTEEAALACASHEAGPRQVAIVSAWLERMGLGPDALACGAHPPGDVETQRALGLAGLAPSALHNNCSGKHAGMLAVAIALGAPTRDYLRLAHPVQQSIVKILCQLTGLDTIPFAVDGCSAPTAVLPLAVIGHLGALLAAPKTIADAQLAHGLDSLAGAMILHADLVGGRGVLDTLLMRSVAGLVAKRGADGVYLMGLQNARAAFASGPVGIAIKVEDGSGDARAATVMAVLEALGVVVPAVRTAMATELYAPRKNHRGLVVGRWVADLTLEPHAP